jgi:hypothetical protein
MLTRSGERQRKKRFMAAILFRAGQKNRVDNSVSIAKKFNMVLRVDEIQASFTRIYFYFLLKRPVSTWHIGHEFVDGSPQVNFDVDHRFFIPSSNAERSRACAADKSDTSSSIRDCEFRPPYVGLVWRPLSNWHHGKALFVS